MATTFDLITENQLVCRVTIESCLQTAFNMILVDCAKGKSNIELAGLLMTQIASRKLDTAKPGVYPVEGTDYSICVY
jgi:hypothetical protein